MMHYHEKKPENKTQQPAANINSGSNAVQLKDNRQHSVVQQKLSEKTAIQKSSFSPIQRKGNAELKGMSDDNLIEEYNNLIENWYQMTISPANRIVHALANRARRIEQNAGNDAALPWWQRKRDAENKLYLIRGREDRIEVNEAAEHQIMTR